MNEENRGLFGIKNSLIVVLLSGLLALFIGLTIRAFLNSEELAEDIREQIRQEMPDSRVSVERIHTSLANGWWPEFSVRLSGVSFELSEKVSPCLIGAELEIEEARLPFRFFSLVWGGPKWGRLGLVHVRFNMAAGSLKCLRSQQAALQRKSPIVFVAEKKRKKTRFPVSQVSGVITGVLVRNLEISEQDRIIAKLNQVSVQVKGERLTFLMNLKLSRSFTMDEMIPPIRFRGELSDKTLQLEADGGWREGVFSVQLIQGDQEYDVDFNFKHVPIAPVSELARKLGYLEGSFTHNGMWASCVINLSVGIENGELGSLKIPKCELSGEVGEAVVSEIVFSQEKGLQPFEVAFKKVDLLKFVEAVGRKHPLQSLGRLGHLSGIAAVKGRDQVQFAGQWKGLEFIFSNRGVRKIQAVESFRIDVQRSEFYTFQLSQIQLASGVVSGQLAGRLNKSLQNGVLELDVQEFSISPEIQQLMLDSEVAPISVMGQLRMEEGKLTDADVELKVESVKGPDLGLENVRFQVSKQSEYWLFDTSIDEMILSATTKAHKLLEKVNIPKKDDPYQLNGVKGQFFSKSNEEVKWSNFQASIGQQRLRTSGSWGASQALEGEVRVGKLKYQLVGTRDEPQFLLDKKNKK